MVTFVDSDFENVPSEQQTEKQIDVPSTSILETDKPVIYEDMPLGLDKTSAIPLENKKFRSMLTFQQANGDNINGIHVSIPRQALETSLTRERDEYLRQSQVPGISQQKKEELEKQVEKMNRFIGNLAGQGNRIFYKIRCFYWIAI